jgi:hypothetical protein
VLCFDEIGRRVVDRSDRCMVHVRAKLVKNDY